MAMSRHESSIGFRMMAWMFKARDFFSPRMDILREVEIEPGDSVLDYGCGPGSYVAPLAELVGPSGRIWALDIHPLAIQMVQQTASAKRLENVETILSDCETGLPDDSVDVVLMYDILHDLENADDILQELHRVLKPDGTLSVQDPHRPQEDLVSWMATRDLFELSRRGEKTISYTPV
jgi:ubiquinone/menaquinone biosynthesis C-methylase UbiE